MPARHAIPPSFIGPPGHETDTLQSGYARAPENNPDNYADLCPVSETRLIRDGSVNMVRQFGDASCLPWPVAAPLILALSAGLWRAIFAVVS